MTPTKNNFAKMWEENLKKKCIVNKYNVFHRLRDKCKYLKLIPSFVGNTFNINECASTFTTIFRILTIFVKRPFENILGQKPHGSKTPRTKAAQVKSPYPSLTSGQKPHCIKNINILCLNEIFLILLRIYRAR